VEGADLHAWLVRKTGPLAGTRHLIHDEITRVGRSSGNDVILSDSALVSARHFEIRREGAVYLLRDLDSTNGTYINGERITEAPLGAPCSIQLGTDGPELGFIIDDSPLPDANQTLMNQTLVAPPAAAPAEAAFNLEHHDLLTAAVARARHARRSGIGDSTVVIMREMLEAALHRTRRKFKKIVAVLGVTLVVVSAFGFWKIDGMRRDKRRYDGVIQQIEAMLQRGQQDAAQTDQLIEQLDRYEDRARALQNTLLFRVGAFEHEESIKREIKALLVEFGAEVYSIPPEFLEEVKRFIQRYQGPDRPHMERALGAARKNMDTMRRIFQQNNLPPDLAYIVLVESALAARGVSSAGAVGLWQFTPETARAYGLKVNDSVDERKDAAKSTQAACKYIRDLILDFGAGSSVMLALAAYNLGPARVKAAVRRVNDPIKQRSFWYLYRVRAVPPETREYVPKVIAAMLIARHPDRYGF
jgi:soluble lytic murein transglycosylase-like protein